MSAALELSRSVLSACTSPVARRFEPLEGAPFGTRHISALRLDNGLRVLLLPDPRAKVFAWHTWFRVGSRHEKPGRTGIAHLFEHMMFKATKRFGDGVFDRAMETRGAQTNAATWVDWTYYHEVLPSSRGNVDFVAEVEADRMVNLVLNEKQLASEREVVINERRYRVEDDPDGLLGERLSALALGSHPYGWPTIGWMADIEAITLADCEAFYRAYYAPNDATVIAVGGFDPTDALESIVRHYGPLASSTLPVETVPPPPRLEGVTREEHALELSTDRLYWGLLGPALDDPGGRALDVGIEILCGGDGSRLHRKLVDKMEIATSIDGFAPQFRYPGLIEFAATAREPGGHVAIEKELVEELSRLGREGPTDAEVRKAKNQVESAVYRASYAPNAVAGKLGFYDAAIGDFSAFERALTGIRMVTASDVKAAAARWLDPERRAVVVGVPNGVVPGDDDGDDEDGEAS